MTPLGHLSVSYLAGKTSRHLSLPAIMIAGLLPDIDFMFVMFPWFNQIHRVVTHNLFFICLMALFAAFLCPSGRKWSVLWSMLLGGFLHVLIDSCLDNNPSNGIGVAFLWPFYHGFFSPVNVGYPVKPLSDWRSPLIHLRSGLWGIMLEFPFWVGAAILYLKSRMRKTEKQFT